MYSAEEIENLFGEFEVGSFEESFAVDNHGWSINHLDEMTGDSHRGYFTHHHYKELGVRARMASDDELAKEVYHSTYTKRGQKHTAMLPWMHQEDYDRDVVGPYHTALKVNMNVNGVDYVLRRLERQGKKEEFAELLAKLDQPRIDQETDKPLELGYGVFIDDEANEFPSTDTDRWEEEYQAWKQDQAYYNSHTVLASKDAADRRARRFLYEQAAALDAVSTHDKAVISKAYKAAWTRYRWFQLYSAETSAGLQWLNKDQWLCVEAILAEGLGLFGKTISGRYGKRPAIAKQRLTTKEVRKWHKLAIKRYAEYNPHKTPGVAFKAWKLRNRRPWPVRSLRVVS